MKNGELELWYHAGEFTTRKRTRQASTAVDELGVFGRGESSPNQEKGINALSCSGFPENHPNPVASSIQHEASSVEVRCSEFGVLF